MLKSKLTALSAAAVLACVIGLGTVSPAAAHSRYDNHRGPERVLIVKQKAYVFTPYRDGTLYNTTVGYWHPRYGFAKPIRQAHYGHNPAPQNWHGKPGNHWKNPPHHKSNRGWDDRGRNDRRW